MSVIRWFLKSFIRSSLCTCFICLKTSSLPLFQRDEVDWILQQQDGDGWAGRRRSAKISGGAAPGEEQDPTVGKHRAEGQQQRSLR